MNRRFFLLAAAVLPVSAIAGYQYRKPIPSRAAAAASSAAKRKRYIREPIMDGHFRFLTPTGSLAYGDLYTGAKITGLRVTAAEGQVDFAPGVGPIAAAPGLLELLGVSTAHAAGFSGSDDLDCLNPAPSTTYSWEKTGNSDNCGGPATFQVAFSASPMRMGLKITCQSTGKSIIETITVHEDSDDNLYYAVKTKSADGSDYTMMSHEELLMHSGTEQLCVAVEGLKLVTKPCN